MNDLRAPRPWAAPAARAFSPYAEDGQNGPVNCPRHGPLDASWLMCPACVRERRAGGAVVAPAPSSIAAPTVREPRSAPAALLLVQEGDQAGRTFRVGVGATRIGRDPRNEIALADPAVSRFHASISRSGSGFVITDQGSTNGTFVNGERVEGVRQIEDRDLVRAGSVVLLLKLTPERPQP